MRSASDTVPAEGKWRCSNCKAAGPVFGLKGKALQEKYPSVERPWNCAKRLVAETRCPACGSAPPCLTLTLNYKLLYDAADRYWKEEKWMEQNGRWGGHGDGKTGSGD